MAFLESPSHWWVERVVSSLIEEARPLTEEEAIKALENRDRRERVAAWKRERRR